MRPLFDPRKCSHEVTTRAEHCERICFTFLWSSSAGLFHNLSNTCHAPLSPSLFMDSHVPLCSRGAKKSRASWRNGRLAIWLFAFREKKRKPKSKGKKPGDNRFNPCTLRIVFVFEWKISEQTGGLSKNGGFQMRAFVVHVAKLSMNNEWSDWSWKIAPGRRKDSEGVATPRKKNIVACSATSIFSSGYHCASKNSREYDDRWFSVRGITALVNCVSIQTMRAPQPLSPMSDDERPVPHRNDYRWAEPVSAFQQSNQIFLQRWTTLSVQAARPGRGICS